MRWIIKLKYNPITLQIVNFIQDKFASCMQIEVIRLRTPLQNKNAIARSHYCLATEYSFEGIISMLFGSVMCHYYRAVRYIDKLGPLRQMLLII